MNDSDVVIGSDGLARCPWGAEPEIYRVYHDTEWGRRREGDDALFERMSLEGFQAGLSWLTILRKREAFRAAFADFSIAKVAAFDDDDASRLLSDPAIVRNRAKIDAVIGNARLAATLDGGLSRLLWSMAPARTPRPEQSAQIPATTADSRRMSQTLRKMGFRFVGPTTAYALMQATGMVDDHLARCHVPRSETA